jgi:hypothetical protein
MESILTPDVLFAQAGLAADADVQAVQTELARRGWDARIEGPLATPEATVSAARYRAVAVKARGVGRPNDPAGHPTHLERTAASPDIALRGVLATVLALELGAMASMGDRAGASAAG